MSLSHRDLYFTQLLLPPAKAAPCKSNPPRAGEREIDACEGPSGKQTGPSGKFLNHSLAHTWLSREKLEWEGTSEVGTG